MDEIIALTLAGGKPLLVRRQCVIAAHQVLPGEADPKATSKVYLSNGASLYVRELPEECLNGELYT
jgi:hypothetical protein